MSSSYRPMYSLQYAYSNKSRIRKIIHKRCNFDTIGHFHKKIFKRNLILRMKMVMVAMVISKLKSVLRLKIFIDLSQYVPFRWFAPSNLTKNLAHLSVMIQRPWKRTLS